MKLHRTIAAGTALALLMAAPLSAAPFNSGALGVPQAERNRPPVILAQASIEELRLQLQAEGLTDEQRAAIQAQIDALEAAAPAEEAPAAEEPAPAEQPAEEAPAAEEPAPVEEAPAEEPAAEEAPAAEEPAPAEEAPTAEEPAAGEPAAEQPAEEAPAAEEPAPAEDAPATEEPAPAEEAPAAEEPAAEQPAEEAPAAEEPAPAEEAPAAEEPAAEEPAEEAPAAEDAPAEEAPAEEPATAPADQDAAAEQPENAAPVLDSQKEAEVPASGEAGADAQVAQEPAAEQAPPPTTDAEAQAQAQPENVESATAAEGTRVDEAEVRRRGREQRSDAEVIGEIAGRILLTLGGRTIVESDDRERLRRGAEEVYYEDLRRGRTRETIVRRNGTRIVTIRDRYGDIIRRSRITPDGREYVLVYAGDRDRDGDRPRDWRDPGRNLPPLRLTIPVNEYILDARRVDDPDRYYDFLDQPPVEPVRRLYSVDEVKYSARIRDSVRRVDLDNLTFDFGSAAISQSEVAKLEDVAGAMARLLEENPGETFLIEGHTDAVGTEQANLALSDRRAETVATALTDVFQIPPENLVTQGYGETYLKVKTEEENRTNRRVAIRRITPLVAPVASR